MNPIEGGRRGIRGAVQEPPVSREPEEFMDFTAPHAIRCRRTQFGVASTWWKGGLSFLRRLEPGLVDRDLATVQHRDLALVDVDADDVVAGIGETRAGHETDVARAEDRDFHL